MAKTTIKKKLQFWGTGRRKKAIARVRLIPGGTGAIVINDRTLEDYFPQGTTQYVVKQPLAEIGAEGKYDIFVNVIGGGYTGQAGAIRLGISRALLEAEPETRPALTPQRRDKHPRAQEGGLPHERSPRQREKEIRSQESTQSTAVLQEMIENRPTRVGFLQRMP